MKFKSNNIANLSFKNIKQTDIFSKVLNSNIIKNKKIKKVFYRNNLSNDNNLWKTNYSINENNSKTRKNINSINIFNNSILEYNNNNIIKKRKMKKSFHSSACNINSKNIFDIYDNKSPTLILHKNNYNIKQIHDIISKIGKKLNSFHNINKKNKENFFLSKDNNCITNKNSSMEKIITRDNKRKATFNNSKIVDSFKIPSFLSTYKENINLKNNNIKRRNSITGIGNIKNKINKNDLIPFPYKRIQKKIRKYFSFSKKMKIFEDEFPMKNFSNNINIKKDDINEINIINFRKKNKILPINKNKNKKELIYNSLNTNGKTYENKKRKKYKFIIFKEDKSVGTENTFYGRNLNNLNNNKNNQMAIRNTPFFNNELIAFMTNTYDNNTNKLFITTKELEEVNNKRNINIYYKDY